MTLSIQTRCPHCFSCFNLPAEQLDQAEAKGRCGQCQQIFLVNDHLVVSADNDQALVERKVVSKSDTNSQSNAIDQDSLEHMSDYNGSNFETGAYKVASYNSASSENTSPDSISPDTPSLSIENMTPLASIDTEHSVVDDVEDNVWQSLLDQAMATDIDNFDDCQSSNEVDNISSSDFSSAPTIIAKSEHMTTHTASEPIASLPTETTASIDSVPADSVSPINSSIDSRIFSSGNTISGNIINDNKFMKNDRQLPIQANSAPNLTHLLTGKTTSSNNQSLNQQPIIKPQSRIQTASTSTQTPVASILWLAGCLVLVLLLFAQYVIFNLNTLIKTPAYAAQLQTVCSIVVCSLPNADLSELSITELSYRSSQVNTNDNFSDIKANLVNDGTHAQLLPSLKVSVYDNDGLLGSFIAMPDNYLLSSQNQLAGEAIESVMFTVPVAVQQIHQVTIDAIY